MKPIGPAEMELQAATIDWYARKDKVTRDFLRLVDARKVNVRDTKLDEAASRISKHWFTARSSKGRFAVAEAWCNNATVVAAKAKEANELRRREFKVQFLPTKFSTRWVGERQPVIIVPPGSLVDPYEILTALQTARFKGVKGYARPDGATPAN
jgi:hypothetical protein